MNESYFILLSNIYIQTAYKIKKYQFNCIGAWKSVMQNSSAMHLFAFKVAVFWSLSPTDKLNLKVQKSNKNKGC